jgi:hypothetical protein
MKFVYQPHYPHRSPEYMKTVEYRTFRYMRDQDWFKGLSFWSKLLMWWKSPNFMFSVTIEWGQK